MYLLYLDDSGSPKNPEESHFVLAGVCIPEESVRWLSHQIELIAERINPTNPSGIEFHAAECFRGTNTPWKQMEREERISTIKRVLSKLDDARQCPLFGCAIHKASFHDQDPVRLAFEDLSSRFNLYLEHLSTNGNPARGMIVIDKSSYELGLQSLASEIRRTGNRWGNQNRNICEVPLFVDSKSSRLIQLADHIAYAIFRRYSQNDLNYYNVIENKFYQLDGVIHGLAHKQLGRHTCTCPACITRR